MSERAKSWTLPLSSWMRWQNRLRLEESCIPQRDGNQLAMDQGLEDRHSLVNLLAG